MPMRQTGNPVPPGGKEQTETKLSQLPRHRKDKDLQQLRSVGLRFDDPAAVLPMRGPGLPVAPRVCCCGGLGSVLTEPDAKGNRYVSDCVCRAEARIAQQLIRSGLPALYTGKTLEGYQPAHLSQQLAQVKARGYVEKWLTSERKGLCLVGPVGTGKTHLAIGIMRELVLRYSTRAVFHDVRQLLKRVQESFSRKEESEAEILAPILRAEFAVLDELGAARNTEWTGDTLEYILGTRYNDGLPTVITTNLAVQPPGPAIVDTSGPEMYRRAATAETLGDRIGGRMLSRLHEMCDVIEVTGPDHRMRR